MSAWYARSAATAPTMAQCALMRREHLGRKYGLREGREGRSLITLLCCARLQILQSTLNESHPTGVYAILTVLSNMTSKLYLIYRTYSFC